MTLKTGQMAGLIALITRTKHKVRRKLEACALGGFERSVGGLAPSTSRGTVALGGLCSMSRHHSPPGAPLPLTTDPFPAARPDVVTLVSEQLTAVAGQKDVKCFHLSRSCYNDLSRDHPGVMHELVEYAHKL